MVSNRGWARIFLDSSNVTLVLWEIESAPMWLVLGIS